MSHLKLQTGRSQVFQNFQNLWKMEVRTKTCELNVDQSYVYKDTNLYNA